MKKPARSAARRSTSGHKGAEPGVEPMVSAQSGLPEPDRMARRFGLHTILSRPLYLAQSRWLEHIPFAFWLMEALKPASFVELGTECGSSYFAFCQAAAQLDVDIDSFAIGSWPTGPEGDSHFAALCQYNEGHYSAFSRLKRGDAEQEAGYFQDTEVDLLHICGTQSYQRTRAAFESWLPNLSQRAVVLLHDSDMRGSGYGVNRLVAELRDTYPVFEFRHGQGLAVIGVGSDQNETLSWLFEAAGTPSSRNAIQNIFGRLGRACGDSFQVQEYQGLYHQSQAQVEALKEQIDTLLAQVPVAPPLTSDPAPAQLAGAAQPDSLSVSPPDSPQAAATLQAELDSARTGLQERFEEVAKLIQIIQELEHEKAAWQADQDRMRESFDAETSALRKVLSERETALKEARTERDHEAGLSSEWERMFYAVKASRSWRILAPVRGIVNTFRNR